MADAALRLPEKELLLTALHSISARFLSSSLKFADVIYNREFYVLLIQTHDNIFQSLDRLITFLHGSIEMIQQTIEKSTGHTFSFAFTDKATIWGDIAKQFVVLKAFLSRY